MSSSQRLVTLRDRLERLSGEEATRGRYFVVQAQSYLYLFAPERATDPTMEATRKRLLQLSPEMSPDWIEERLRFYEEWVRRHSPFCEAQQDLCLALDLDILSNLPYTHTEGSSTASPDTFRNDSFRSDGLSAFDSFVLRQGWDPVSTKPT